MKLTQRNIYDVRILPYTFEISYFVNKFRNLIIFFKNIIIYISQTWPDTEKTVTDLNSAHQIILLVTAVQNVRKMT